MSEYVKEIQLREELEAVLHRNEVGKDSGSTDAVVAQYLIGCLRAYTRAVNTLRIK